MGLNSEGVQVNFPPEFKQDWKAKEIWYLRVIIIIFLMLGFCVGEKPLLSLLIFKYLVSIQKDIHFIRK